MNDVKFLHQLVRNVFKHIQDFERNILRQVFVRREFDIGNVDTLELPF